MRRWLFFLYGVGCHLMFLVCYAWLACFVGNIPLTKGIDSAPENTLAAAGIDLLLILLFGLQHSIMARPAFKKVWTRIIPPEIERSTYVLIANLVVFFLIWQWRGIDVVVWDVQHPTARMLLWGLFAAGWLMVPAVSLMINHFDLFGTRQVWLHLRGRPYAGLPFRTPMLYSRIRHPLYVGWTLAFWATPTMTLGHLLFAGSLTLYMVLAALVEERDLVNYFGDEYRDYQRRVPRYIPRLAASADTPVTHPAAPVAATSNPLIRTGR